MSNNWITLECEAKVKSDVAEIFKILCKKCLGRNPREIRDYFGLEEDTLYSICKLCIVTDRITIQIRNRNLLVFYIELPEIDWWVSP